MSARDKDARDVIEAIGMPHPPLEYIVERLSTGSTAEELIEEYFDSDAP